MESTNIFSGGMSSDLPKLIQPKNTYLEAVNLRLQGELGGSNTSLVTIKGNECQVKFPQVRSVYKLKINILNSASFTDTVTITVNGQTTANITINTSTTGKQLYDAIIALNNAYLTTNLTPGTATFMVTYKDDYIVITQQPLYTSCSPVTSITPTIVVTQVAGTNRPYYVKPDNTTQAGNTPYIDLSAGYAVIPIGSTFILDDDYVYTAIDDPAYTTLIPANDSFTKAGQIWKLTYDEVAKTSLLTLMYNAYLDFGKYHPIAPTATTARYESIPIQRLYWTDFYNKIKTVNVGDPQLMALNPTLSAIIPSVGFDIPIFRDLPSGTLQCATYQLCYRLKQSLGAITNYSPLSNMVHLVAGGIDDFGAGPTGYEGSIPGINSNKAIRWDITNIDTSFDTIEYVVLYREQDNDIPQVFSILEEPTPASGTKQLVVSNLNNAVTIPLQEFLTLASSFTHAKTVDTKDNRLFWGNVKNKSSEINFDARAFRAKTTNTTPNFNDDDIHLKNGGVDSTYTSAQAQSQTTNPKTNDSINEYYDSTGVYGTNACYYKPGAAYVASGGTGTPRPILGGTGVNISYEFNTYSVKLDDSAGISNSDDSFNIYNSTPFRFAGSGTTSYSLINNITASDSTNQVYISGTADSLKFPYKESLLRGFQHEEIYRFGIQFFDLEGSPYFTEWIGDIKFPTEGDFNKNPDANWLAAATAAGIDTDFRNSFFLVNSTYGNVLGIKFSINITSVKDIISGYRIVRVDREALANKTILGCGVITPTYADGTNTTNMFLPANFRTSGGVTVFPAAIGFSTGNPWRPIPSEQTWETLTFDTLTGDAGADRVKTFDCFDSIINGGLSYASGDKLLIRSRLEARNYIMSRAGSTNRGYRKWFDGTDWWGINTTLPSTLNRPPASGIAPGVDSWALAVGATLAGNYQSGLDSQEMPYYMYFYYTGALFPKTSSLTDARYTRTLEDGSWVAGDSTYTLGVSGFTFHNYGATFDGTSTLTNLRPCVGAKTMVLGFSGANAFRDNDAAYGCNTTNAGKLLCLYYRPNVNQYGGNTYSARSQNEYLACGSYIPVVRKNKILSNNLSLTIDTFGGDVFMNYWDHQKVLKNTDSGSGGGVTNPTFRHYTHGTSTEPGNTTGVTTLSQANNSVTYWLPVTNYHNQEVRTGYHLSTSLGGNTDHTEDEDTYYNYHSNDNDIIKYYPKPAVFVSVNEWINRIYYSEVKFNNELQDSWQAYKTNNFYDVEGNYGGINSLVSLKENLHFIQERGFGYLYVNPITTISGDNGLPVTLGKGDTIEKHRYLALDVGTKHQWSVYKSQDALTFVDVRHKKIYMFNGESLTPISDQLGQRNFVIKRLHNTLITNDNPIIGKGILTTYDYFNNEFLYTFKNNTPTPDATNDENYTLAYSEPYKVFSGLYTFMPIMYINNNRNLYSISSTDPTRCWIHNKGIYATFYGTLFKSSIKTIINDNPKLTKIFNNLSWLTESIKDNTEWQDDLLIPSISTSQTFSDNVNYLTDTFKRARAYNEYQNTDYITLDTTASTGNLRKVEQQWNIQEFRNKVNYDTNPINTTSIFDPTILTKTTFGDRMRDKYLVVDLEYDNALNNRFIVHNINSKYNLSDR